MGKEKSKGNEKEHDLAEKYTKTIENELQGLCDTILELLKTNLIGKADSPESKVFYQKMKADYYRYIAEFRDGEERDKAAKSADMAYAEAHDVAAKELAV